MSSSIGKQKKSKATNKQNGENLPKKVNFGKLKDMIDKTQSPKQSEREEDKSLQPKLHIQ